MKKTNYCRIKTGEKYFKKNIYILEVTFMLFQDAAGIYLTHDRNVAEECPHHRPNIRYNRVIRSSLTSQKFIHID